MAARRPVSVCLTCQARQAVTGRRRQVPTPRRYLHILASPPLASTYVSQDEQGERRPQQTGGIRTIMAEKASSEDPKMATALQEAMIGPDSMWMNKDKRVEMLRRLSNPWPDQVIPHRPCPLKSLLAESNAGLPIPHEVFRKKMREAFGSPKHVRQVLRRQLLQCEWPREIYRVMAVAMQNRFMQQNFAALHEPIMRALYRARNNVDDTQILTTLNSILARFQIYGLRYNSQLSVFGLKFAARTRSLRHMKKYLKAIRNSGLYMSSNVFRSAIAKFSIGHRGLGEIRNGRWKRDELLQVLTGFHDCKHLQPEQQFHLGTFLNRADWQFLHGWIAVLARCKDRCGVWREWVLWKQSEARLNPKNLASMHRLMTTRLRGDYWFLEQMTYSGGLREAWQILDESGIVFVTLKDRVKTRLLEGVEHARVWNDDISNELLKKYDRDLGKIEEALGIRWVSAGGADDAEGHHELVDDQETVLSRLSEDGWVLEEDYGYPYDTDPIVLDKEKSLHNAAEISPAE